MDLWLKNNTGMHCVIWGPLYIAEYAVYYNRKTYSKSINIGVSSSNGPSSSSFWTLRMKRYTATMRKSHIFRLRVFKSA